MRNIVLIKDLYKFLAKINIKNTIRKFLQYHEIEYIDKDLFKHGAIVNKFYFVYYSNDILDFIRDRKIQRICIDGTR